VVDIPDGVRTLNEYIALFSKKYRNRAKSILKNAANIEVRNLNEAQLKAENKNIYKLYEQVYNHAKFKLVKLPETYFLDCKSSFPDKFTVTAFYYKDKLVAFSSGFDLSNELLEAHYIGFDYELNKEIDLYQNILYNFLEQAIMFKKKRLNLGRTAGEIKSTVGAHAQELTCYIKPQNTVSRMVLKPFINFLQPGEWIPRNPFKEEQLSY
jgi:predicted porin